MTGVLTRLGARLDTWSGEARMRRFRTGWPASASDNVSFLRTAKVQYRYRVVGEGRTIVFTVDPPMTLENYDDLLRVFSQRFRVVAVELPAMGFSATSADYAFGFRETNNDLAAFLRAVAGENAILAFSCVASLAAIDLAVRQPELCSHLALIQAGDAAAFAAWKAGRDPKGVLRRPVLGQLIMKRLAPKRMPQWYALSVGKSACVPAFCACAQRSFEHGALWSLASAYQIYMGEDVALTSAQQPMLSLWGGADGSHPPTNAHSLRRLGRSIFCETFDDLGHTPELEDPERVFASIAKFVGA